MFRNVSRRRALAALGLGGWGLASVPSQAVVRNTSTRAGSRFVVCYGAIEHPGVLASYDVLVLEAETPRPTLHACLPSSRKLGYLSLCEVHTGRRYAVEMAASGLLLGANPSWIGARYIDIRDTRWWNRVIEQLVPELLDRGFDGMFIDTLDDADHLETSDPRLYKGMRAAAIQLMHDIRSHFPTVPIMVNRGYGVLPSVLTAVDMVMAESLRSTFDSRANAYVFTSQQDYAWQRDKLLQAKALRPEIELFSLDYWNADDAAGRAALYAEARAIGVSPYVSTVDLRKIISES